jgi:formylglycine-generating enzyme required for sulfatase activity
VQLFDAGEAEEDILFMALELVEGQSLADILKTEGALPLDRVVSITRQVLAGIAEAHKRKIIHRDLKTENILIIRGEGEKEVAKIADFGVAKFLESERKGGTEGFKTQEGWVMGTPQYMSPEQAAGEEIDGRSDLYSLGVIMYEMLLGTLPYKALTPMQYLEKHITEPPPPFQTMRPDLSIPQGMERIVMKALEKNKHSRYQSAEEFLYELDSKITVMVLGDQAGDLALAPVPSGGSLLRRKLIHFRGYVEDKVTAKPIHTALIVGALAFLIAFAIIFLVTRRKKESAMDSRIGAVLSQVRIALNEEKNYDKALELLLPLKEQYPNHQEVLQLIARAQLEQKKRESLHLSELQYKDKIRKGDAALVGNDFGKAEAFYLQARAMLDTPEVMHKLAELRIKKQQFLNEEGYRRFLKQGDEAKARHDYEEAVRKYRKAREKKFSEELGWKLYEAEHHLLAQKADRALKEGNLADAIRLYREALKKYDSKETEEKLEKAKRKHRKLLSINEREEQYRRLLEEGRSLERVKDFQSALGKYRDANHYAESSVEVRELIERVKYRIAGQFAYEESAKAAERLLLGTRKSSENIGQAIKAYEEYLQKFPKGDFIEEAKAKIAHLKAELEKCRRIEDLSKKKLEKMRRKKFKELLAKVREHEEKGEIEAAEEVLRVLRHYYAKGKEVQHVDRELKRIQALYRAIPEIPEGFVSVASGKFILGGDIEGIGNPRREAYLSQYYIGKYEVTNRQYAEFCKTAGHPPPPHWSGGLIPRGKADHPVAQVSFSDAVAYCRWLSQKYPGLFFRLPTEAEWEKAARGARGNRWPWGNEFSVTRCNTMGRWKTKTPDTLPATDVPEGASPYGLHHAAGNVWEWTRDTYQNYKTGEKDETKKIIKGGGYLSSGEQSVRCAFRSAVRPLEKLPDLGFRCVLEIKK